jgi:hypothetical protein
MPLVAPENSFGLFAHAGWFDGHPSPRLREQLSSGGIEYTTRDLPFLVGMAGSAALVFYLSPKTGQEVTVLAVPQRYDVDQVGEEYYYFQLSHREAVEGHDVDSRWNALYDQCKELIG